MLRMTDVMVDTETTGLNPQTSAIIQLSAIKFNFKERAIGQMFDRAPAMLPMRSWHEGTREFWMVKNRATYDELIIRQEEARPVFLDFFNWIGKDEPEGGYRFWAKPTSFDWPIVASHMEQLGLPMPMHYRIARDMNSFIAGLRGEPDHYSFEEEVPFNGTPHNALHDCAWQLDVLFHAADRFLSTEVMS